MLINLWKYRRRTDVYRLQWIDLERKNNKNIKENGRKVVESRLNTLKGKIDEKNDKKITKKLIDYANSLDW